MPTDPNRPGPVSTDSTDDPVLTDEATGTRSPRESAALERVRRVARLQDEAIRVPGTQFRFGLDPVLSLLPVGGDALAAAISLYPIVEAARLGVPKRTLVAMLGLVTVDAVVGSVPVLGSLFDAVWKANEWNRRLLEGHIEPS
ncbi:DUF4112 domain-containing protein [Haloarcula onubensis]|uniref:DUF4112 domain-containing protein n=1 Tax=Haloarcula onubensis TaxID=2950539 RepID=A0ABU2FV03_9EURY|nr:DUF4112 domain-containing protein [Halomicroarcula sp. S3CR25-11]MDS0284592.1 DUF4112 domain-containing protein [Halomicroarcula sp. S3CR25-11]